MTVTQVPYVGLIIDDSPIPSPSAAIQMVEQWIAANHPELDEWALYEMGPIPVRRAWWGGDELGFVGEQHPLAQPVVVCPWFDPGGSE